MISKYAYYAEAEAELSNFEFKFWPFENIKYSMISENLFRRGRGNVHNPTVLETITTGIASKQKQCTPVSKKSYILKVQYYVPEKPEV